MAFQNNFCILDLFYKEYMLSECAPPPPFDTDRPVFVVDQHSV